MCFFHWLLKRFCDFTVIPMQQIVRFRQWRASIYGARPLVSPSVARVIRPGRRAPARPRRTSQLLIPLRGMPGSDDPGHTYPTRVTLLSESHSLKAVLQTAHASDVHVVAIGLLLHAGSVRSQESGPPLRLCG